MYDQDSTQRGRKKEREYYENIRDKLADLLRNKFDNFHLEVTADKRFSNTLKGGISQHREIIFSFLKEAAPDIAGFIRKEYSTDFIVVEVKRDRIKLDDVYQTRKYAELFDARYALLISKEEIPDEIVRLSRVNYSLLALSAYKTLSIVRYEEETGRFIEWFPRNPFEEDR